MDDLEKYKDLINHSGEDPKDEISEFLNRASDLKVPSKKSKDEIWQSISESIDEENVIQSNRPLWKYFGIAASIALLVALSFFLFDQPTQIELLTSTGEQVTQTLPDGSTVILNASSVISYSDDWNRELTLEGEAFFEITKGENFVVKTPNGEVQVLGTSFNVYSREEAFVVACKTGKVNVTIPLKSFSEDIVPGEIVSMKDDTVRRTNRLPELMGKWNTGEFYFNHQPISEVIAELQRQFSIEIEYDGRINQEFSGYFTNKNLENALDMVCLPLGLEYQKTGQNTFAISQTAQ